MFHYYLTESDLLTTEAGIGVGSTVGELTEAYPTVRFHQDCGLEVLGFIIDAPAAGGPNLPIFGLLDGDPEQPVTRIVHIGAGLDRSPC